MTAQEPRSAADGNARGFIVLAVALVVGVLLLLNLGGGASSADGPEENSSPKITAPLDGTTTTVAATTTTAASREPSEVKVLVLNGGGPDGAAGAASGQIEQSGYEMGAAGNSPVAVEATTVFYADDHQPEATAVALLLGRQPDVVKPLAEAGLNGAEGDAKVVVILGSDAAPA